MATILIVSDDEEESVYLGRILTTQPWQTDKACCLSRAVELAKEKSYNAVIFDFSQSRPEVAETFRKIHEALPEAFEVVLTARPNIDSVYHAVEAGAQRVLAKPVDPKELVQILEAQLSEATSGH